MTGQDEQEEKGNNSVVWPALYCPCPASPVHRGLQPSPPSKHSEEGSHYLLSDWGHLQVTWSQCPWSELCSDYAALARSCDHLQSRAALFFLNIIQCGCDWHTLLSPLAAASRNMRSAEASPSVIKDNGTLAVSDSVVERSVCSHNHRLWLCSIFTPALSSLSARHRQTWHEWYKWLRQFSTSSADKGRMAEVSQSVGERWEGSTAALRFARI